VDSESAATSVHVADVQAELAWERATAEVRSHQVAKRIGYSASISQLRWVNFTRRGFIKAPLVGAMFRTSEMGGNKCWDLDSSYTFTAEIDVPQGGAEGMIVTQGGRFGGYGVLLARASLCSCTTSSILQRTRWQGPDALTPGKHTLEFDFKYDGLGAGTLAFNNVSGIGRRGTGVLKVDGKEVARQRMEHSIPLIMQWDENFDIGADTGTPVDDADYQVPFRFTGKLEKLTLKIDRPTLSPEDLEKLKEATRNNKAAE
jgi:hypothetical protein